jgi:tetratricopeptide (TPR) repeat protein
MGSGDPIGVGSEIGDLRILARLGRGAFGEVFLAEDHRIGRKVALKIVPLPDDSIDDRYRHRAQREARAIARVVSPRIVTLYRIHPPGPVRAWMFEMEYVEGTTLAAILGASNRLSVPRSLRIASQIAAGLEAAHAAGVVHGDVKPSNILVAAGDDVKLVDFGLSRILGEISQSGTAERGPQGTPLFMAPEVVTGERPSPVSDVWSFGVLLYRMLTGRMPFPAGSLHALLDAVQFGAPDPLDPEIPADLSALCLACLEKSPAARPQSCVAIAPLLSRGDAAGTAHVASAIVPRGILGRERELRNLAEAAADAAEARGAAILVTGPVGIGKSSLLRAARSQADLRWIETRITPLEGLLRPLLASVRALISTSGGTESEASLFRSAAGIVRKLLDESTSLRLESRSETLWALEEVLAGLAADGGAAIAIDDAQNAAEEDLRLLRHLASSLPPKGLLLVIACHGRDPEEPRAAGVLAALDGVTRRIELGPLPKEDVYRLAGLRAGVERVAPEVLDRVHAVSRGNPLFVAEIIGDLLRTRAAVLREGALEPGPAWRTESLPARLRDFVLSRVTRIASADRSRLEIAAIAGVDFDGESVAAAAGEQLLSVLRDLQRIYREHGIIEPTARGFRFVSAVHREAIYGDIAPELRGCLHRRFAEQLECRPAARAVPPEELAHHWARAGELERARPWFREAAIAAARRQEIHRAVELADLARDGESLEDPAAVIARAEFLLRMASVCADAGRADEGTRIAERVADAAKAKGDETLRLRAVVRKNAVSLPLASAPATDEAELRLAAERPELGHESRMACYLLGLLERRRAEFGPAEAWFRRADAAFVAAGDDAMRSATLGQLAALASRAGRKIEAEGLYADAARISAHVGRRTNAAVHEVNRVRSAFGRGNLAGVGDAIEKAIRVFEADGAASLSAHATALLAEVRYAEGNLRQAEEILPRSVGMLQRAGNVQGLLTAHLQDAELSLARGHLDRSLRAIETAREFEARVGPDGPGRVAGMEILVRSVRGEVGEAATLFERFLPGRAMSPSVRADLLLRAAEALWYGLGAARGEGVELAIAGEGVEEAGVLKAAAALARAAGLDGSKLREAASILVSPPFGQRRAYLSALGLALGAAAARWSAAGRDEALRTARVAADAAGALGHAPLAFAARRRLLELGAEPPELGKLDGQFAGVWRAFPPSVGQGWLL